MKKTTDTLGTADQFQTGDLVCWTDMRKKRSKLSKTLANNLDFHDHRMTGVVAEVFFEHVGGRNVAFASIFCFKNEQKYEIPLISLKRIEKSKTIYRQEGANREICYN